MNYKTLWDSRSDSGLGSGIHGVCFQAEFGIREGVVGAVLGSPIPNPAEVVFWVLSFTAFLSSGWPCTIQQPFV